jgi:hypothetical protein
MRYVFLVLAVTVACGAAQAVPVIPDPFHSWRKLDTSWKREFDINKADLSTIGRNQFFILEPGFELTLEAGTEKLVVTVLDETRVIDDVNTRAVQYRETVADQLIRNSRSYFAISPSSGDVYHFGEEIDIYNEGMFAGHKGPWLAGVEGARIGLMMPGSVERGAMYYQEFAPLSSMDRARVVSTSETVVTPVGTFRNCLKIEKTSPLEPESKEHKYYAADIGLVRYGALRLTKYGNPQPPPLLSPTTAN